MASAKDGEIPKSSGRFAILTTLGQPNAKEIGNPKESSESNSSIRRSNSIGDINTAMKEQDKQKKLAAKARKDAEKSERRTLPSSGICAGGASHIFGSKRRDNRS